MANIHADDLYERLGVASTATHEEVRRAYRALLRQFPPERAPEEFKRIREAYETLVDPRSRKEYDTRPDPNTLNWLHLASAAMDSEQYEVAERYLKQILLQYPELSYVRNWLGLCFLYQGKAVEATAQYERLLSMADASPTWFGNAGHAYRLSGRYAEAERAFRRAILTGEDVAPYFLGLVDVQIARHDYDAASSTLEKAINHDGRVDFQDLQYFTKLLEVQLYRDDVDEVRSVLVRLRGIARGDEERKYVAWKLGALTEQLIHLGAFTHAGRIASVAHELQPQDRGFEALAQLTTGLVAGDGQAVANLLRTHGAFASGGRLEELADHINQKLRLSSRQTGEASYDGSSTAREEVRGGALGRGRARIEELPGSAVSRLLARQKDARKDQIRIPGHGAVRSWIWVIVLAGYLTIAFLSAVGGMTSEGIWLNAFIGAGAAIALGHHLHRIAALRRTPVRDNVFLTPLYYTETKSGQVEFWPLWELTDFNGTHNRNIGGYSHTDFAFTFNGGVHRQITVHSKKLAENILDSLRRWAAERKDAAEREDWEYFRRSDDFHDFVRPEATPPRPKTQWDPTRKLAYGVPAGTVALMLLIALANEVPSAPSPSPRSASPRTAPRGESRTFRAPVQPLPLNGSEQRYHSRPALAPLEIVTGNSEQHYFVKVVDWETNRPVTTFFVRAGRSAEVLLPLGTYRVKYAAGETWYGQEHLFGPNTAYATAQQPFHFRWESDGYAGYTVQLYKQIGGNLQTRSMSPADF